MRLDGQSLANAEDGRAVAHRAPSARPLAAALWLLAGGTLAWLLAAGASEAAAGGAPWLIVVSWFAYVTLWRPCLRVDGCGFEVINGLRDHRIPFGAVEDIEVRFTTVIRAAGKKYVSWGAPTPPTALGAGFQHLSDVQSRPYSILPSNERISQPEAITGRDAVVAAWRNARFAGSTSAQDSVTSTWNKPVIAVGVLSVLAAVITASQ
jgi:hypothetical protein